VNGHPSGGKPIFLGEYGRGEGGNSGPEEVWGDFSQKRIGGDEKDDGSKVKGVPALKETGRTASLRSKTENLHRHKGSSLRSRTESVQKRRQGHTCGQRSATQG